MTATGRLAADAAARELLDAGFGPLVGVPCSHTAPLVTWCERNAPDLYVAANNEGEAVAIAAGLHLAGRRPVVMLQNSGLGNAVNPLTSLCHPLRVPLLLIVTWRGEPGVRDEPQHELMGPITPPLLELMEIETEMMADNAADLRAQVRRVAGRLEERGLPSALVMRPGTLQREAAGDVAPSALPFRRDVIAAVVDGLPDDVVVVATTGKTARELAASHDRPSNLYVVGSMGCASSVGLGIAMDGDRPVVVLDGDGAALMRLEALVSIGAQAPRRLVHVVLDNAAYESTGAQRTNSPSVDLPAVAGACGYATAVTTDDAAAASEAVRRGLEGGGPHFVRVGISVESDPALGRPERRPHEVAAELRALLTRSPSTGA